MIKIKIKKVEKLDDLKVGDVVELLDGATVLVGKIENGHYVFYQNSSESPHHNAVRKIVVPQAGLKLIDKKVAIRMPAGRDYYGFWLGVNNYPQEGYWPIKQKLIEAGLAQ